MNPIVPGAPVTSVAEGEDRARYVQGMFARIVPRYDLLNRILSLGLDQGWRRRTLELLETAPGMDHLDACCGTGDLALMAAAPPFSLATTGSDFCAPMVEEARRKGAAAPRDARWLVGDSLRLPFPDERFDRVTVAFGVRNLGDLEAGLREFRRVLRPGGRLAVLEFSQPIAPVRWASTFYLRYLLPLVGKLGSGHDEAYAYLPETILRFPDQPGFAAIMEAAGFQGVTWESLTLGIVAVHVGERASGG